MTGGTYNDQISYGYVSAYTQYTGLGDEEKKRLVILTVILVSNPMVVLVFIRVVDMVQEMKVTVHLRNLHYSIN